MAPGQPFSANTVEGSQPSRITPEATVSHNDSHDDRSVEFDAAPPRHPVSALQTAFEESIMESVMPSPKKLKEKLNAEARRRQLLELDDADHEYSSRWTQRPGAKFHPLWKLIAQISFGIHLLHKNLAKSEDEVVRILQGHVDEVDSFAEDTTADFDLAIRDIKERIQYLLLPLEHSRTFNKMLCDKSFRASILDGNDIIERVIQRTRTAMDRSLSDVSRGIEAVCELSKYLERLGNDWNNQDGELLDAYHVMRGNAEGWYRCFLRLQAKGENLGDLMVRLESILDEVALRAGIASRRKTPTGVVGRKKRLEAASSYVSITTRSSTSSAPTQRRVDKPLPPPPSSRHSPSASRSSASPLVESLSIQTMPLHSPLPTSPKALPSSLSPIRHLPSLHQESRSLREETGGAVQNSIIPTTLHVPQRSPTRNIPKSATDSAYSSCAETPMLSPHKHDNNDSSRPSFSTVSSAPPSTPRSAIRANARIISDPSTEDADHSCHGHDAEEPVTALPTYREPCPENKKLRKPSITMRTLFTKKQSKKDMSGGLGACVSVT